MNEIPVGALVGVAFTGFLGLGCALVRMWGDIQQLKAANVGLCADLAKTEAMAATVAAHGVEIALLKASVGRLEQIPDKIDRLLSLAQAKA